MIIVMSPLLDQNLGFLQCVKHFAVQEPITQATVEAFVVAVLTWGSGRYVKGFDL